MIRRDFMRLLTGAAAAAIVLPRQLLPAFPPRSSATFSFQNADPVVGYVWIRPAYHDIPVGPAKRAVVTQGKDGLYHAEQVFTANGTMEVTGSTVENADGHTSLPMYFAGGPRIVTHDDTLHIRVALLPDTFEYLTT